ncbi:hypothetical protein ACQP1U_18700 [Actinomycetota bacterium]
MPIGGGYSTASLQGFARQVMEQATGTSVDIAVIPSSYGDAPADRAENLRLAGQRAAQIDRECEAVVDRARFPDGCTAPLLPLLAREDALDPANSAMLTDPDTDGAYVLGGDQVLAMHVLANTPAETALAGAFARGAVVGGTSAGNAVESRSMGAGYPDDGYPWNALERDKSLIFWGDDLASEERGLSFGSQRVILDQHFYERGRFGRLLSWTAQSVERYGGAGKVGVGVDWGTAVVVEDDARLVDPFGATSNTVIDMTGTTPRWVGPQDTLSVRGVRTHLMAPGTGAAYDLVTRVPTLGGSPVGVPAGERLPQLTTPGSGTLWLGGGDNDTADSASLRQFASAATGLARGASRRSVVVIAAGYADASAARAAAATYRSALAGAGWSGDVRVLAHGTDALTARDIAQSAGVLVIGGDQARLDGLVGDARLRELLADAVERPTPVMTDGAATAAFGERYVTDPDPTTAQESIDMFLADGVHTAPGLGLVPGWTIEPTLTYDYRWGRLFGAAHQAPKVASLGVSELTSVAVSARGAQVVGERSAITVDGSSAAWRVGSNGALGAANVWLSASGPGDAIG